MPLLAESTNALQCQNCQPIVCTAEFGFIIHFRLTYIASTAMQFCHQQRLQCCVRGPGNPLN
eukprot:5690225-Amphidinium_carterae.1